MFKNCRVPVSRLYLRIIYRCINFLAGLSRCIILVLHQKFAYTFLGIQQTILRQIFYAFFGEFALRGDCTVHSRVSVTHLNNCLLHCFFDDMN